MIAITIHTVAITGADCRRCGQSIPGPVRAPGLRVGVIVAPASGACASYPATDADDAPPCAASPLVARIESLRKDPQNA
jgi:hypothetical protein